MVCLSNRPDADYAINWPEIASAAVTQPNSAYAVNQPDVAYVICLPNAAYAINRLNAAYAIKRGLSVVLVFRILCHVHALVWNIIASLFRSSFHFCIAYLREYLRT